MTQYMLELNGMVKEALKANPEDRRLLSYLGEDGKLTDIGARDFHIDICRATDPEAFCDTIILNWNRHNPNDVW